MKQSSLTIFFAALMTALFSACSDDFGSKEIPSEELYTRAFIKEFGIFDANHTWCAATPTSITVNPQTLLNDVKVYSRTDGKYYYVAHYTDVYKTTTITFDAPRGTTDLKLVIDGTTYYAQAGTTLTVSGGSSKSSRSLAFTPTYTDGVVTADGYTTGTDKNLGTDNNVDSEGWLEFDYIDGLAYREKVPEGVDNRFWTDKGITQDFMFRSTGETTVMYPVYWETTHTHTIGVYYFLDDDATDGETISYLGNDGSTGTAKIKKVPLYTNKSTEEGDLQRCDIVAVQCKVKNTEDWVKNLFNGEKISFCDGETSTGNITMTNDQLSSIETYIKNNGFTDVNGTFRSSTEVLGFIHDQYETISGTTLGSATEESETVEKVTYQKAQAWHTVNWDDTTYDELQIYVIIGYTNKWIPIGDNAKNPTCPDSFRGKFRSKGIKFKLPEGTYFGMYTNSSGGIYYSQSGLNSDPYMSSHGNTDNDDEATYGTKGGTTPTEQKSKGASHAVSFQMKPQNQETDWLYLCFEDWNESPSKNSDMDMNDMIVHLTPYTLEVQKTDDITSGNETYKWLICAEDLGTDDDFDFNDVILAVTSLSENSYSKVTFKAMAAGGTLPITLHFNYNRIYTSDPSLESNITTDGLMFHEGLTATTANSTTADFHNWFDSGYPLTTMINTKSTKDGAKGKKCILYIADDASGKFTLASKEVTGNSLADFYILVDDDTNSRVIKPVLSKGDDDDIDLSAPQMFVILDNWDVDTGEIDEDSNPIMVSKSFQWPIERKDITVAYPSFTNWLTNSSLEWFKDTPTEGTTCRY